MILTEQEAKEKWCPLSRVLVIGQNGMPMSMPFNRTIQTDQKVVANAPTGEITLSLPESCQCAGSVCMMWRWLDKPPTEPEDRRGFCGVAMNPHTYQ